MNNIKNTHNYKIIKEILDKNIKKVKIVDDHKKNVYSLLKTLPIEFLKKKFSNQSSNTKNKVQFNTSVEPLIFTIKYFDNQSQELDSLYIYNNFEIIEKEMIESFININESSNYLCKCFFEKGKIIINMQNNLNKKIISLIGSLENYYHYFLLEYILIYNNEKYRIKHFKIILGNLDKY